MSIKSANIPHVNGIWCCPAFEQHRSCPLCAQILQLQFHLCKHQRNTHRQPPACGPSDPASCRSGGDLNNKTKKRNKGEKWLVSAKVSPIISTTLNCFLPTSTTSIASVRSHCYDTFCHWWYRTNARRCLVHMCTVSEGCHVHMKSDAKRLPVVNANWQIRSSKDWKARIKANREHSQKEALCVSGYHFNIMSCLFWFLGWGSTKNRTDTWERNLHWNSEY